MKRIIPLLLIILFVCSGYKRPDKFQIDAVTNAARHNMMGSDYLLERCYYAAIQEFKIAISLNPNTQSSAVYYTNLGLTYMQIGFPNLAEDCFERALKLYGLNFQYYENLVDCYVKLKKTNQMISKYSSSSNPLDKITLGLLYIKSGQTQRGIMVLDDFCMSEPDLIVTHGVKSYLRDLTRR